MKAAVLLPMPPAALNFWTSLGGLPQKFGTLFSRNRLGALETYDLREGILEAYVKTRRVVSDKFFGTRQRFLSEGVYCNIEATVDIAGLTGASSRSSA